MFSEQFYRVWRLQNQVDVIITDSPMLLSIYYNKLQKEENKLPEELIDPLILYLHNQYENLNYFIKRSHRYEQKGRKHTEQESIDIEQDMLKLYKDLGIEYKETHCSEAMANLIVSDIKKKLEEDE